MSLLLFHHSSNGGLLGVSSISLYCPLAMTSGEAIDRSITEKRWEIYEGCIFRMVERYFSFFLVRSCISFLFCIYRMFFTLNCFQTDLPKVKAENSDFSVLLGINRLFPQSGKRSILTCWIQSRYCHGVRISRRAGNVHNRQECMKARCAWKTNIIPGIAYILNRRVWRLVLDDTC